MASWPPKIKTLTIAPQNCTKKTDVKYFTYYVLILRIWLQYFVQNWSHFCLLLSKYNLDFTELFFRTKLVSRCGLTAVCNRVNEHDVLQLLLIISNINWSDSKSKEAKQQLANYLEPDKRKVTFNFIIKRCFHIVLYKMNVLF